MQTLLNSEFRFEILALNFYSLRPFFSPFHVPHPFFSKELVFYQSGLLFLVLNFLFNCAVGIWCKYKKNCGSTKSNEFWFNSFFFRRCNHDLSIIFYGSVVSQFLCHFGHFIWLDEKLTLWQKFIFCLKNIIFKNLSIFFLNFLIFLSFQFFSNFFFFFFTSNTNSTIKDKIYHRKK